MKHFTGTGSLLRLALRRDRIQLPVWLFVLTVVFAGSVASVVDLYGSEQARIAYAMTTASSAVARAFNGSTPGASLGAIAITETFVTVAVLLVLMTTFAVVRHTRQNEETGRAELVGAGVVGRYAQLTAALLLVSGADVLFGGLATAVLIGAGLPVTGSVLTGAALAVTGVAFAGVAAVAAQVAEGSRAANGLAAAALGVSFVARAAGDAFGGVTEGGLVATSAWPSWLSPIGWAQQVRPFKDDAAWLLILPAALAVLLVVVAFALTRHRDLGTGMMPVRRGPATAPRGLLSPIGLAWRLQRGAFIGWLVAFALVGVPFGAVLNEVDELIANNPDMAELIQRAGGGATLYESFLAVILGLYGVVVTGFTVQALLRLRGEEAGGPLESVLATAVSRPRWMASHVVVALLGTAVLITVAGATTGLGYGLVASDAWGETVRGAGGALVRLPATLVVGGFVVAVFGLLPRLTAAVGWAALAVCLLIMQVGALLELPRWVMDLSPFTHVPNVPAEDVTAAPVVGLLAVAVALGVAGFLSFRRRDLAL
jgi:ABC-2 type transport system permease protein